MTSYSGVDFAHIRKARWAVLFDHLKLKWRYRPDPIAVDGNFDSTPDFELALPTDELIWVVVKARLEPDSRLAAASEATQRKGLVVTNPAMREMTLVFAGDIWLPSLPLNRLLPRLSGLGTLECTAACNRALIERFGMPSFSPQRGIPVRQREQAHRLLDEAGRNEAW